MQSIDMRGMDELEKMFDDVLQDFPEDRRSLHEEVADIFKQEVDRAISGTVHDSRGRIRGWQAAKVGSGGGYAAIRAQKGETGDNSPGAITNYLESGHQIRTPKVQRKNYHPRIKVAFVAGRQFYARAAVTAEARAIQAAIRLRDKLAERMGGG